MDKIVFIIPNMTGGGTERVISLLSTEYIKRGFQVAIMQFAGYQHAYELDSRVEDFSISEQSGGNPLVQIRRIRDMRRYLKRTGLPFRRRTVSLTFQKTLPRRL